MKHTHTMPFGASMCAEGGVRFALWAPGADQLTLQLGPEGAEQAYPMQRDGDGWHHLRVPSARADDLYRFELPSGLRVPDPASRRNPHDVHGPSQVVDPAGYTWQHPEWRGRPWAEAVIYELHVGTFTAQGTFAAAQSQLAQLAELGITAVELMPVADFPGRWNWGYDGVLLFAPDSAYGSPNELKAFVDAAHGLGLMVLIDVVYNHFGPEGNYLHAYCPQFFNPAHQTPWGAAINFDGAHASTVRQFFVHNALYWVNEFQFDGLRMDAIHAIRDDSPCHIVQEVCNALRAGPGRTRQVHVVLENDANQTSMLTRDAHGVPRTATAQWNDDIHHAIHVLTTGETDGYYLDYAQAPLALLGRALAQGFIYQGQASPFRQGELRGEPCSELPLAAFVSFLQTHDQVGNRAFGERIHALAEPHLVWAACACVLLSPHTPMLFMGEEYAACTPFQYFCDFAPDLAQAVANGRRAEFGRFAAFSSAQARARIPDPNAQSTFLASKLQWHECATAPHAQWRSAVAQLLALRQSRLVALFSQGSAQGHFHCEGQTLHVHWPVANAIPTEPGLQLVLIAHFGQQGSAPAPTPALAGEVLYTHGVTAGADATLLLAPGAVHLTLQKVGHV